MDTERQVYSKQDIIDHVNKSWNRFFHEIVEIKFEYCTFDDRTGWDTYYVLGKLSAMDGHEDHAPDGFIVLGMSDGKFD